MVRCGRCERTLPASEFSPSQRKNGYKCRPCKRAYETEQRSERPSTIKVCEICARPFPRRRGFPTPVCSEKCRKERTRRKAKAWYAAHKNDSVLPLSLTKEYRNSQRRKDYARDPAKHIAQSLAYQKRHPEVKRATDSARYARTRGAPDAELFTLDEIFQRDDGRCGLCTLTVERKDATMDHIHPVSLGGPHTRANVQLAHRSCNSSKGNRLVG